MGIGFGVFSRLGFLIGGDPFPVMCKRESFAPRSALEKANRTKFRGTVRSQPDRFKLELFYRLGVSCMEHAKKRVSKTVHAYSTCNSGGVSFFEVDAARHSSPSSIPVSSSLKPQNLARSLIPASSQAFLRHAPQFHLPLRFTQPHSTMAIIPWIKGLEATVEVDGQTAQEYDPPEREPIPGTMEFHELDQERGDGDRFVVKYIEVKPGAPFKFRIKKSAEFEPHYHGTHKIGFQVMVDGQFKPTLSAEGSIPGEAHHRCPCVHRIDSIRAGSDKNGWVRRRFRFSTLNIGRFVVFARRALGA